MVRWLDYNSVLTLVLVPCAVFRFAVFAPAGYYQSYATTHNNVIKANIELHNGTYSPLIQTGEKIAAKWGVFGFYWNFAIWIPTFWFPPPLNLPIIAVDTAITVYISLATHHQTSYAPHNKGACNSARNGNFSSLQRPPGTDESFYQAAARLNATVTTPQKMCETFVKEWQMGIALSFFYALITLLNIIAFFGSLTKAKESSKSAKEMTLAVLEGTLICIKSAPKGLLILLAGLLYFLPQWLFRLLPNSWKAPVRYGRRTALKTAVGVEQRTEMKMNELKTEIKNKKGVKRRYAGGDGKPSKLSEFLSIYDMLITVTEQLHYLDVINLSQVSKSVREAVLPVEDFDRRMNVFKIYSCDAEDKSTCWTCSTQICGCCSQIRHIRQTTILWHQEMCQPYCSRCYHEKLTRRNLPRSLRTRHPYCTRCAPTPAKPPTLMHHYINGSKYYADQQESLQTKERVVCTECSRFTDKELLEIREEKTKVQLKQGLQANGQKWTKCTGPDCGNDLGTGPRWWICTNIYCGKECQSWMHKAWGKEEKDENEKDVVGDQAV